MRFILISLALSVCAAQATGGPWPRGAGKVFLSLGYEATTPRANLSSEALAVDPSPQLYGYTTVYGEFGLTDRWTIGLDAGRDEGPDTWSGVVFARYPIGNPDRANRFAVQLGIGQRRYEQQGIYYGLETMEEELILRPLVSWGRGFSSRWGDGWLTADLSAEWRDKTVGTATKLDLTAGLAATDRTIWMVQVQTGDYPGSPVYMRLQPGLAIRLREGITLENSLIAGLHNDERLGFKIALWFEF